MPAVTVAMRRINQHIVNLNSPDQKVSSLAEDYLIRYYGSRALDPLVDACDHPNRVVRFRAVWALAFTHDPRAYETVLRLTDDPDEAVRYDATIALGILGDERAIAPLIQMYLEEDVSRPAGMAFSRLGLKSVPALTEVPRQGNSAVRHSVVQVLGDLAEQFGDEYCIELLQGCRNDPEPMVREDSEYWLNKICKIKQDLRR